ncbi:MAG: HDOD domain-containing protein [bacterium]
MDEEKSRIVLKQIERMPSLSPTVAKIMQVANDPASSANDLNKVISLDPVLAAKVLKLVNSAYFGLNDKITSTVRAIVILGLNTIKNLALSTAALETMKMKEKGGLDIDQYWRHLLGTGVMCKLIARKIGIPKDNLEDFFLAGLLHDIGKVVLNRLNTQMFRKLIDATKEKGLSLPAGEGVVFGINHAEIGELLGGKWGLTDPLVQAMAFHHNPAKCSDEHRKIVFTTYISNNFCKRESVGDSGNGVVEKIDDAILGEVGITPEQLDDFSGYLLEGVDRAAIFLKTAS